MNRNHFDGKSVNGTGLRTTLKITEKPKIFEFLKLEFLNNVGEKPKRKSYIFITEKTEHKICVLKHTWVSRKLYGLIFLEIQRIKGQVLYGSGILSFDRSQVI